MTVGGWQFGAGVLALVALSSACPAAQAVALDVVLERLADYVDGFVGGFSNVVTEELYEQNASGLSQLRNASDRRRVLRSDFLLVRPSDSSDWQPFRDVFEVNGLAVRDREERLAKLFLDAPSSALNRAREIANEGARYNLGGNALFRTVNNPLLALAFLMRENQVRFRFELGKREPDMGPAIQVLEFREQARPTFVRGAFDRDLPARGRLWVDVGTGRVAQVEITIIEPTVTAMLTTVFRHDDRLKIDAPHEMRELYRFNNGGQLTGTAKYGRFRRFDVRTDEAIEKPR